MFALTECIMSVLLVLKWNVLEVFALHVLVIYLKNQTRKEPWCTCKMANITDSCLIFVSCFDFTTWIDGPDIRFCQIYIFVHFGKYKKKVTKLISGLFLLFCESWVEVYDIPELLLTGKLYIENKNTGKINTVAAQWFNFCFTAWSSSFKFQLGPLCRICMLCFSVSF